MGRIRSFEGLACLVTGASSGIGREIAYELARRRARVVVTARRADRLDEVVAECARLGAPAAWRVPADLASAADVERLAREAEGLAGPIDVLVNNAGFAVPGLFPRSDLGRTLEMLRVNVEAPVILARRLLPGMLERDRGGILNVASVAGFSGSPVQSAYAGSKAFLRLWSHSVHAELKHTNVAITALCPGVTDTEFFDAAGFTKMTGFMRWRASAAKVARTGLDALARGTMQVIPGGANKTLMFARRLTTERFAVMTARRLMMGRAKALRSRP
jgi:short-subunit dehydrogenase